MLKFFRLPFATTGDKTAVPDAVDSNGNVSYSQGYGFDYQRQKTDPAAKNIERDKMNQVLFDITSAIAELQSQGAPDYITSALNGGAAYSYAQFAIVKYSGALYISLVAANTALPSDATKWALLPTPALLQQSAYMSAVGAGTVDAITAAFSPAIAALPAAPGTLSVFVRATGANTSATPTFRADGTAAKTIVKGNNVALLEGDIAGSGHWLELQYDATLDRWVLQNPTHGFGGTPPQFDNTTKTATTAFVQRALGNLPTPALLQQAAYISAVAGGTVDAITAAFTPAIAALPAAPGTLAVIVRATGANTSATPTFRADGTAAKTIVKGNNLPLVAGDIAGAGHWLELQYDATLDRWVLQNPTHGFGGTPPQFDNTARTATTGFVQRALGNYAGASSPSGATTLTAADCGRIITFGGAGGYAVSFPATSAVPNGASVLIQNIASAAITIARQGTDSLVLGTQTATSVSCGVGEFFVATRSGGNWVLTGSLTLANTAAFGASFSGTGYQRLPSGLILQWGRVVIGDISRDYFSSTNFPITFPNNIFQVILTLYSFSGASFDASAAVTAHWQTGFDFTVQEWSGSTQSLELSYFAIGN